MSSIKTASVLAFERKLCNSDGLMYSGSWKNRGNEASWSPISLQHKDVRGTISNRLKDATKNDPLKMNAEVEKANLQSVDIAALPFDSDTLKLVFTLRVLGDMSIPVACNDPEYQNALSKKIGVYLHEEKCLQLSKQYAETIANGRFLWRNRIGAEEIEVRVSLIEDGIAKRSWNFNSNQFDLRKFSDGTNDQIVHLAQAIQQGLMGDSYIFLKIEAFARIGEGQEVFPSQELVRETGNEKYKKSKVLYSVNEIAAMHSQKIGNAIRTIDIWHPQAAEVGPIPVEPYGSVTSRGVAYRKEETDFYSLLDGWITKNKVPSLAQQHFVVACLIRGGVFGEKKKEKKSS
ncbi:type I-F CRISPR-associated protein Csy3 [Chlamydiales bacterium]|nr:type I-F CRISPR-associated protein Csy3 [Chlamydiales bacterium]